MKMNSIKTKVIGTVLAAVCAVSAVATASTVGASAAKATPATGITTQAKAAKNCIFVAYGKTAKGYDWDYRADNTSAKISCTYDFKTNKYTFKAVGQFAGVTNAVLKYATIDGMWHNIPVRFTTDKGLNVTGKQTGKEYVTKTRTAG